jgi:hypothetical protein
MVAIRFKTPMLNGANMTPSFVLSEDNPPSVINLNGPDVQIERRPQSIVTIDERQTLALLEIAQVDRTSSITQAPKLNIFNGQRVPFECTQSEVALTEFRTPTQQVIADKIVQAAHREGAKPGKPATSVLAKTEKVVSGWRCNIEPVVTADRRATRLSINLEHFSKDDAKSVEHILKAAQTVVVPDGRTLVWHLGETAQRQHLFVLLTPSVQVRQEEEGIYFGPILPIPGR